MLYGRRRWGKFPHSGIGNVFEEVLVMTHEFGSAVQDFYLDLVRKNSRERKRRLEKLRTRADAEKYVLEVREKIRSLFPLPAEKCPLQAQETGVLHFDSFTVHKILFQSRPSFPVTGNLYLPRKEGKLPAVLFLCGHSAEGKAYSVYQHAIRGLVTKGYAVFAIDPVSQGERLQFRDEPEFSGGCCPAHNVMGKQLLLLGESMSSWRAWDAIRGLDYLLGRPEVDSARVGLTGCSGGGTMTTIVGALEDRFAMTAPSCYITTWLHNVENEIPADLEQAPPGVLGEGLEMGDFLIARAPRPLTILAQKKDFFDPRGAQETFEEVRKVYALLGAGSSVRLTVGPDGHGYSKTHREAMYSLFNDTALPGVSAKEPDDLPISPEQDLFCTEEGQVDRLSWNRSVHSLLLEKLDDLLAKRRKHTKEELCALLKERLKPGEAYAPHWRVLRQSFLEESVYSRFGLETGEDSRLMCVLKRKGKKGEIYSYLPEEKKITLYIPHSDAQEEQEKMTFPEGEAVYGLDIRGCGDCTPFWPEQPYESYFAEYRTEYRFGALGMMFSKPYLGGKVKDILCAVELLSRTCEEISVVASGHGTIPALLAALLSDKIKTLKCLGGPDSWETLIRKKYTLEIPLSLLLFDILSETDLPEIREALKDKLI